MQLDLMWEGVLAQIRENVDQQSFERWFESTSLFAVHDEEVQVVVPNRFSGDWIKGHYLQIMNEVLKKELSLKNPSIQFVIKEEKREKERPVVQRKKQPNNLNSRYTFESFVVGASNQFAHAASRKVGEWPGMAYNPLFLYGGVGLGKTHLLSAIGNFISSGNPQVRIAYLSSEQFTNDVIHSIRYNKMSEFRNRYRSVDALLIDDIQFIAGKERTQEEFFHTFNTLYELNNQIVLSSDRPAKEISDIEERLRSRFEMGLIADIQPPDLETKIVILRKKAELENINLPNDVTLLLASNIKTNIRVLEGSLIRLGAFSSLTGEEITVEMAKRVLRDTIQDRQRVVTVDDVQRAVSERFQVRVIEIKSKKRTKNLVIPRQIGMYLSRELTNLSYPEIGKAFGGKDHSTVMHACKQIEKGKGEDFNLKLTLESLTEHLKEG